MIFKYGTGFVMLYLFTYIHSFMLVWARSAPVGFKQVISKVY